MIFAMKIPTTLICLPVLALGSTLLAQNPEQKPVKQETKAEQKAAQQTAEQKAPKDSKVTMADPAITAIDDFIKKSEIDKTKRSWKQTLKAPPKVAFSAAHDYFWHIETEVGQLTIRYFTDTAPIHVASGIYLPRLGYYDGLNFHRIIPGFMAQGGCPTGSGTGNPGFFMDGEFEGGRSHDKAGILSMANTGRPRSDGAQFFITFGPTKGLDGRHTVWGELVEGTKALQALEKRGTRLNDGVLGRKGPKIVRTWVSVAPKKKAEMKGEDMKDADAKKAAEQQEGGEHKG